ncbi:MAG: T9SS type A sorting domain-containing protein [Cyclobacteriaceae bacterium]|nr:T9SS type A sorting domain-containing protein [Cyclobacteriaceae bacterium]
MTKYILSFVLLLTSISSYSITYYAISNGAWNTAAMWSLTQAGAGGAGVPGAGDDVYTNGFIVGVTDTRTCRNIFVDDVTANGLFLNAQLTVTGSMIGHSRNLFGFLGPAPNNPSVAVVGGGSTIIFTGADTNTNGGATAANVVIGYWHSSAIIPNSILNFGVGNARIFTISTGTLDYIFGNLTISSGDLSFDQATVTGVQFTGTLTVDGSVQVDIPFYGGTTSTNFPTMNVNGTVIIGSSAYLNANTINLNSGGVLNVENNQTNGWWHDDTTGPTFTPNVTSSVNYNRGSAQGIAARTYGNLSITSGGAPATKTLSAAGTLTVQGNLSIGGSNTFASSNANTITVQGTTTNDGIWTISQPIQFNGGGTQLINGTSEITFNNAVTFSNAINIDTDVTFGSTVSCGSNNMSFAGGVTNNGTFSCTGTVTFDGVVAQSIGGSSTTTFTDLTISNTSSTATVNGTGSRVLGTLTLSASSGFNANGLLTLVSDAAGTARVAAIPASATFSGNLIYQRYIDGAQQWHNIGFPVSGTTTDIISSGYPDPNASLGGDLSRYNETAAGDLNQGWETSKLPFTAIDDAQGYSFWTRTANTPGTLTFEGPLNTGNMSLPITRTVQNGLADDGWNLVNNPYASQIDWASGSWTKTNIDATIYVWNGVAYNPLNGTGTIASGQSFWVHANAASPVLNATQNVKTSAPATFYRISGTDIADQLSITLGDGVVSDLARIRFMDDAMEEFDSKYDGYKLQNDIFNLASTTQAGLDLSINTLPSSTLNRTVKLNVSNINEGSYQLKFDGLSSFDSAPNFTLIDSFLSTSTIIEDGFEYNFTVTSDTTSYGSLRFSIVVESQLILGTNEALEEISSITVYPNPVTQYLQIENLSKTKINLVTIYDLNGKIVYSKTEDISYNINMSNMKKGIYIVNIATDTKTITYRVRKK